MDTTDEEWKVVETILPEDPVRADGRGRPWSDRRTVLNGVLWILRTGAPWKDLPPRYGAYQTLHRRFQNWVRSGVTEKAGAFEHTFDTIPVLVEDFTKNPFAGGGFVSKFSPRALSRRHPSILRPPFPISLAPRFNDVNVRKPSKSTDSSVSSTRRPPLNAPAKCQGMTSTRAGHHPDAGTLSQTDPDAKSNFRKIVARIFGRKNHHSQSPRVTHFPLQFVLMIRSLAQDTP